MQVRDALAAFIAKTFNGGRAIATDESLFYSGMIDSLGIQQIAAFISRETGRELLATTIVEEDLDTIEALVERACREH